MMTNNPFSLCRIAGCRHIASRLALVAAFACWTAGGGALAQEAAQQLPDSLVNQQIPQAFPQDAESPSAENAAPQVQKTPDVPATIPVGRTPDAQASAPAANTDGDRTGATDEQQAAQIPVPGEIPAQPEARKLVPATPMGAAAQNAGKGQTADSATGEETPNPVEDAGATEAASSGLPDALEKYARAAEDGEETGQEAAIPAGQNGDALPEVSDANMVRLESDLSTGAVGTAPVGGVAQKTNEELQQEIRTEAFDAAITGMFPLNPEQIETLIKRYDTTQKSATKPPYDRPTPEISVQNVSLDPGVMPPVIKTAVGNVTTINVLDATGAPWPVQDVTWAGDFEVVEPEEGGHIIRITPMGEFARGNIVIRMLTLKTPLTMTLETSRDIVQYRVDARIPEYGPFANAPLMQGAKSTLVAGSSDLTSLLDGVMPGGMEKLDVSGVDGRTTAYTMDGTTYVRTPLTLLSPAWQSSVSSADGMNVYALANAPVLLLSDGGAFLRATLKEKEDLLDE